MSQQYLQIHPPPLPSTAPTLKPDSMSLSAASFTLHFHSSAFISLSGNRKNTPVRLSPYESSLRHEDEEERFFVYLQPVSNETHFDRLLARAQRNDEGVVIVWMANWCRKCIYLKPKLEKLTADYYPRLQFYSVDVNTVSHKLVARAGVTKMPTIQLWKDSKKQAEVIGGHKAYLVINEVQEMIENECPASFSAAD
ncbi:hypothetical protein VNO78_21530 [Psophocarpus tetragonolobus]|uniref:Thioredoxin domain-containing protein n=1 Tax=Psophocarpus tetragonolobus TaxID=3891 RepID=A0AAN9SFG7_PSOTE